MTRFNKSKTNSLVKKLKHTPLKISIIYLSIGFLWILFSDKLVGVIFKDSAAITKASTFKGWFYVIITSLLLYSILNRTFQDLTKAADDLEKMNRQLNQYSYAIAHDLKAPLRAIANLSLWIKEEPNNYLTPESARYLRMLAERVYRMDAMIRGLLAFSRVGREEPVTEKVNVKRLIKEIIDSYQLPPGFKVIIDKGMPLVRTNPRYLEQVLVNLLDNAVKHHHKSEGIIQISVRSEGDFYLFSVADDGPGIEPQYHDKIFDIFQTLKTKEQTDNTGIGLALVRKIVENHQGKVVVESPGETGKGSVFHFTWPKG